MLVCSPVRWLTVYPPSTPGTSWLRSRMLANVPRIITSWLPRREPYELNSCRATPCSARYLPAGESGLIELAGEMWSVVTESPSLASTRAPEMSSTGVGCADMPSKYGGLRTYVESSAHANVSPVGVGSDCHCSSPAKTSEYAELNPAAPIAEAMTSSISLALGQMSDRNTGWPS